jgi:DivIVA domain-containing protein
MSSTSSPHALRPDEVRRKQFTVRLRGLDANEVRDFLNLLADDVHRLQEQIVILKRDHTRQRDDLEQSQDALSQARAELEQVKNELHSSQHEQVTERAVQLLDQAQQLADALIDESMNSAREVMVAARSHQREIVATPVETTEPPAGAASDEPDSPDAALPAEAGGATTPARVKQAQFRAVLDALGEQINRLGTLSDTDERLTPVDSAPTGAGADNGHRA